MAATCPKCNLLLTRDEVEAAICPSCGETLDFSEPPPPRRATHTAALIGLGICNILVGGIELYNCVPEFFRPRVQRGHNFIDLSFLVIYLVGTYAVIAVFRILSGFGLLTGNNWGRVLGIVVASLTIVEAIGLTCMIRDGISGLYVFNVLYWVSILGSFVIILSTPRWSKGR